MLAHVLDTIIISTSIIVTAAATLLAQTGTPTDKAAEMQLLLLPLIGALIASGGMIMLNPRPETRRITIGRGMFALLFGCTGPSVVGMFHPALASLTLKPVVLVLVGACISAVVYVLSKPFTRKMYERAEGASEQLINDLQKRLSGDGTQPLKPNQS